MNEIQDAGQQAAKTEKQKVTLAEMAKIYPELGEANDLEEALRAFLEANKNVKLDNANFEAIQTLRDLESAYQKGETADQLDRVEDMIGAYKAKQEASPKQPLSDQDRQIFDLANKMVKRFNSLERRKDELQRQRRETRQ